ncbi:hypothetical protein ACEQ8H_004159 [Pleosporales sp. CAS-2024a]
MELRKRLKMGSLMRKRSSQHVLVDANADTPEANAARGVRLFCESGAANSGDEVLHLPTIVESAVASPSAAAAAAQQIRHFLAKECYDRPHVQYNAVMLIRILADNPGPSFTKNLDKHFADTVKHLLRNGQDPSVSQIMRESLDSMEREKAYDTNLNTLFAMWRKEKALMANAAKQIGPRTLNAPAWTGQPVQGGFSNGGHGSRSKGLPPPLELAGRIEEARTSAKLLLQLVQSTPAHELIGNELVKEFAERCTAAQRSVQGYIACDDPAPDDDTMLTLIETNEQLSLAASKHQRAVLQARRLQSPSPAATPPISQVNSNTVPAHSSISSPMTDMTYGQPPESTYAPPPGPPPTQPPNQAGNKNDERSLPSSLQAGGNRAQPTSASGPSQENPFADHHTSASAPAMNPRAEGYGGSPDSYHPGYQSTPSYLGRQDSSANNLTMHGAAPQIKEEDENEGRRTPELHIRGQQTRDDVSPIAERNTVTYRY